MAIVSMAVVMTSCSNDNDVVNDLDPVNKPLCTYEASRKPEKQDQTPIPEYSRYIYFLGEEGQSEYLNEDYIVTIGEESITVNQSEYAVTSTYTTEVEKEVMAAKERGLVLKVYKYEIPANMHGKMTVVPAFSLKEGVTLAATSNVVMGAFADGMGGGNGFEMSGVVKDRVESYLVRRNATKIMQATVK